MTEVGYTGQRHDSETGLMYFKNRYYSVSMGQFVTRDPLGYVDGLSMYLGYFGADGVDWNGLEAFYQTGSDESLLFQLAAEDQNMFAYKDDDTAIAHAKALPINKGKNFGPVDAGPLKVVEGFSAAQIVGSNESEVQVYGHGAAPHGGDPEKEDLSHFGMRSDILERKEDKIVRVDIETISSAMLAQKKISEKLKQISFYGCFMGRIAEKIQEITHVPKVFAKKSKAGIALTFYFDGEWSVSNANKNNLKGVMKEKFRAIASNASTGRFKNKKEFIDAVKNAIAKPTVLKEGFYSSTCFGAYYDVYFSDINEFKEYKSTKK